LKVFVLASRLIADKVKMSLLAPYDMIGIFFLIPPSFRVIIDQFLRALLILWDDWSFFLTLHLLSAPFDSLAFPAAFLWFFFFRCATPATIVVESLPGEARPIYYFCIFFFFFPHFPFGLLPSRYVSKIPESVAERAVRLSFYFLSPHFRFNLWFVGLPPGRCLPPKPVRFKFAPTPPPPDFLQLSVLRKTTCLDPLIRVFCSETFIPPATRAL